MEEGEDELSAEVAGLVGGAEVCTEPLGDWDTAGNGGEEEMKGGEKRCRLFNYIPCRFEPISNLHT